MNKIPQSHSTATTNKPNDQPLLNSPLAKERGRLLYKIFLIFLILVGVFIGKILYERQGYSYQSDLSLALAEVTKVEQGKVNVVTAQSGIDAEVETLFVATKNKPQKTLVRLDYLQSTNNSSDDVRLLDFFKVPLAELPLKNKRLWVTIKTPRDISSLESLGFPVGTLLDENANTPLLPFGNFNGKQRSKINNAVQQAFADAEFIHADNGKLKFQTNITKAEAAKIIDATVDTAEPMDRSVIDKIYADSNNVIVTAQVDRDNNKLVELQMVTEIDGQELTAIYKFDYSPVKLPTKAPKSITAEQFVNRYLKKLKHKISPNK